jgi:hypothetical protein
MIRVRYGHTQRIAEDSGRLTERDVVSSQIAGCLVGIPVEFHEQNIATLL